MASATVVTLVQQARDYHATRLFALRSITGLLARLAALRLKSAGRQNRRNDAASNFSAPEISR